MSATSIEQALPGGDRLLLDTTVLIAYFDGGERVSDLAAHVIDDFVRPGRNQAIVSPVTVMEVLIRPLRRGPHPAYQHVMDFLTAFPNLRVASIDLFVAQEAASLRATHSLAAPDALIVATGILSQVGHLITNDANWETKLHPIARRIRVCRLSNHLPFP